MSCPNCHTLSCYICRQVIQGYDHFNQASVFYLFSSRFYDSFGSMSESAALFFCRFLFLLFFGSRPLDRGLTSVIFSSIFTDPSFYRLYDDLYERSIFFHFSPFSPSQNS